MERGSEDFQGAATQEKSDPLDGNQLRATVQAFRQSTLWQPALQKLIGFKLDASLAASLRQHPKRKRAF
jgi:hypothetical protein